MDCSISQGGGDGGLYRPIMPVNQSPSVGDSHEILAHTAGTYHVNVCMCVQACVRACVHIRTHMCACMHATE